MSRTTRGQNQGLMSTEGVRMRAVAQDALQDTENSHPLSGAVFRSRDYTLWTRRLQRDKPDPKIIIENL